MARPLRNLWREPMGNGVRSCLDTSLFCAGTVAMNRTKDTGRCFFRTSVVRAGALLLLACGLLAGPAWAQHFESMEYYHYDALGSVRLVVSYPHDSMTYTISRHDYLPFGEEIQPGTFGRARNLNYGAGDTTPQRFTGKERDPESNLDYFGARYYSGAQGRFTSSDPLLNSGKPRDPQSWDRYSYVRNNPLARIDPTGLYDLNNTCGADNEKCNKQFEQHAKSLKSGLSSLQSQLKNVKDPAQKARLEASLKALGTEGDHNGVNVGFGKTKGGGAGETDPVYSQQTGKETYNITLDPSKLSAQGDYAIAGAHEGTHVDDINTMLASPAGGALSDFSLEYRGYQTSAFAASAQGASSLSMNYDGKSYPIWNGSWGAVDRNITNFVTKFHDKNGQPDHPETTPHNPWSN